MLPEKIIRIALIGPESTGKTTLARQLAEHFQTVWVPEYARDYVAKLNRAYTPDDILITAKEQLLLEEKLITKSNRFIFCDTELIIAKTWCEDVFGKCPEWILKTIPQKKYDLYLLTSPDISWEHDPVRENPQRRDYFFDLYKKEIEAAKFNYEIVSGTGEVRFQCALRAIKKNFPLKK